MNTRIIFSNLRRTGILLLIIALLLTMTMVPKEYVSAAENVHHLVFASDYRAAEGSIESAMKDMPSDTEYVSLIGDMAGEQNGDHPAYDSGTVLAHVKNVFPNLSKENVSMVWADHDYSVNDDAGIVKCAGGRNSGVLYTGKNSDGSVAYYIYGIGYYDMTDGGENSEKAAKAFRSWADGTDQSAPIIVLCHVPIHAARGDNNGAYYWNEALNCVAAGKEGITTTEKTGNIRRNVIFLSGHNYTCDTSEYYYPAGGKMNVQVDGTKVSAQSAGRDGVKDEAAENTAVLQDAVPQNEGSAGEASAQDQAVLQEEGSGEDAALQDDTSKPVPVSLYDTELGAQTNASGQPSNIYYTALTAGYLKANGNATLLTIDDKSITLEKYNNGEQINVGKNGETGKETGKSIVIDRITVKTVVEHSSITVTKTDANGRTLDGAEFALTDADNKQIAAYKGGTFSISTNDDVFADRLPAEGTSVTMSLKETKAPTGYSLSSTARKVVISSSVDEKTENAVLTRTIRYSITIDGKGSLKITNTISGASGNSSKAVDNVPKTGDDSYIEVYAAAAVLAGILLAVLAFRMRRRSS